MIAIYKIWLCYFLFIKRIYKKRWDGVNSSVDALAIACLFIIVLLVLIVLEIILEFEGFLCLLEQDLPLAPIAMLIGFLILLPVFIIFRKQRLKDRRKIYREMIKKVANHRRIYSYLYLIFCCLGFVSIILLAIINRLN
jgi:hypothetical protein